MTEDVISIYDHIIDNGLAYCCRPATSRKINRGDQAALWVVRIRLVCTSVIFSCFNPQHILLQEKVKKSFFARKSSFWSALIYQQGLAEVLLYFRSLGWLLRAKEGKGEKTYRSKKALRWPSILKVFLKKFRLDLESFSS